LHFSAFDRASLLFSIPAPPGRRTFMPKTKPKPMSKYLDLKTFLTIVLAGVTLFFLEKYLTKRMIKDGKIVSYVGTEATGHF
jgi:hypothetical protein